MRWRRLNQVRGIISLDDYHYAEQVIFTLTQKEWTRVIGQIKHCTTLPS